MRRQIVKLLFSIGIIIASILSLVTVREIRARYGEATVENIRTEPCCSKTPRDVQHMQQLFLERAAKTDKTLNTAVVNYGNFDKFADLEDLTTKDSDELPIIPKESEERLETPAERRDVLNPSPEPTKDDKICQRFDARSNVLNTACSASKERQTYTSCDEIDVKKNLKYSKKNNLVYCAIEKTGSTFWKRILYMIGGEINFTNPTLINPASAEYSKDMSDMSWEDIEKTLTRSTNIMFVRDPYARLFSAWLDKFYSPNVMYWNATAKRIAKSQRQDVKDGCVCDITFTEFVNHTVDEIMSGNTCVDRHFSPSYRHCNPCYFNYDFIGKYETMKDDTLYILNALNLTKAVQFSHFDEDAAVDAIKDASDWVFYQHDKMAECGFPFSCALFRVWQRLQSRGLISKSIPFPFSSHGSIITRDDFETAILKAHNESDPGELKHNRKEAMTQAITSLPEHIRQKITKAFSRDFDMFGYDRDPELDKIAESKYFLDCPPNAPIEN